MRRSPYILTFVLLLSGLHLAQHQARADYPFFVTSNFSDISGVLCTGPWFRTSSPDGQEQDVPAGIKNWNFYTAVDNIFSPLGPWECTIGRFPPLNFCLVDDPIKSTNVELLIPGDSPPSVNMPPPPCTVSKAAAFLGDAPRPGQLDKDGFRFDGKAGERLTITLERDGTKGSEGDIAQLSLRHEHGATLDQLKGAVPLELTVTLPSAGSYEIDAVEVADVAAGSGSPFRGFYHLKVTSTSGAAVQLEPLPSVEP